MVAVCCGAFCFLGGFAGEVCTVRVPKSDPDSMWFWRGVFLPVLLVIWLCSVIFA